jgi:integrase
MAIPSFSPLFPCQEQGCGVNNGVKHDKAANHMNSKGASTLSPDEITDLHSLALQLGQATDGVSQYLLGRFAQSTRELLSTYDPAVTDVEALRSALANELSLVINGEPIFEAQRFAGVKLSNATQQCVGRQLKGLGPTRFNRLLLEDSFPLALAKQPKPRQKQETVRVGTGLFRIVGIQGIYGKKKIKGQSHVTALQTDDPERAREKYEEWVVGLRKLLKLVCAEQGTLASFVEPYLTSRAPEVARNKLKPSTIVGQRKSFQLLGEHWKEFRTLPISDLLPETITNLQNHLLTKARNLRTGQPLKLGTYNSLICPLGQLLEYLAREGKLSKELYYALKERIKLADVPSRKVELPTTEQFQKMRAYLYRARWGRGRGECGPKFDVFVLTGIRNATLTAMRVKHIHFAKRTILFTRLKGRAGQADEKELPVVDEVLEVLERHIKARGLQPNDLVFQTKRSNAAFRAAARYAGIATWFQHACRKWFATQALAQTNDAMSVADMLCHRDGGLALFKAYRQSFAAHLEGTVRTLKLLPGATADSSLGAAKARAERALLKFAGLDRDKSAAVLDHILWLESEIDLGHYDIISRLPGLRQPILPMYSSSAKPLCRHPSLSPMGNPPALPGRLPEFNGSGNIFGE